MWGIILILVGIRPKNMSPVCRALSLFGCALWLMSHDSLGWGGVGVYSDRCIIQNSSALYNMSFQDLNCMYQKDTSHPDFLQSNDLPHFVAKGKMHCNNEIPKVLTDQQNNYYPCCCLQHVI